MFRVFIICVCAFGLVSCRAKKQTIKPIVSSEQKVEATHNVAILSGHIPSGNGGDYSGHGDSGGKYASGAELTSLAHSSALQAKTAVQNQQTAGSQAAFGAASSLAQTALGAAATAQAALVGKQVIVQGLTKQLADAEHQLQAELGQFQQAKQAAGTAHEAASQAQNQLNAVTAAFAASQSSAQSAVQAASAAAGVAAAQHEMVINAKRRVAHISEMLGTALYELQQTEASAHKALQAAHIAQNNALAAGAAVSLAAEGSQSNDHLGSDGNSVFH